MERGSGAKKILNGGRRRKSKVAPRANFFFQITRKVI